MTNETISARQFTLLVALFTVGSSILISPSGLASAAKQDAWIAAIIGAAAALGLVALYNRLWEPLKGRTLTEAAEAYLGVWPGKVFMLLNSLFFLLLSALVLRNIGDFIVTQIMPETPIQFIHILFLGVVLMAVRLGLETFGRAAEIFFPWVIFFFLFLVVLLPPQFDIHRMQPIMEASFKQLARASLPFIGTPYLELAIFLMILPSVNVTRAGKRGFYAGVALASLILILISMLSIFVLGPDFTSRNLYPSYALAKKISIGSFLERVEVLMAGIWFITIFIKLTVCMYATVLSLSQTLKLNSYRPIVLPAGMIVIVLSLMLYPNTSYFLNFATKTWMFYSFTHGLVFPLILLAVATIRRSKAG